MKSLIRIIALLLLIIICIFFYIFNYVVFPSKGQMPSESQAISVKDVVADLYFNQGKGDTKRISSKKSDSLWKLKPLKTYEDSNGVLIIFEQSGIRSGYYYCKKDLSPSSGIKENCTKKIADGIYYYCSSIPP